MLQSWPVRYQRKQAAGLNPQILKSGGGRYRVILSGSAAVSNPRHRVGKKLPSYIFFIPVILLLLMFAIWPRSQSHVSTPVAASVSSSANSPADASVRCDVGSIESALNGKHSLSAEMKLTQNSVEQLGGFRSRAITVECGGQVFAFLATEILIDKTWQLKKLTRLEN